MQFAYLANVRFNSGETNLLEKTTAETKQQQIGQNLQMTLNQIAVEKSKLQYWVNSPVEIDMEDSDLTVIPLDILIDTSLLEQNTFTICQAANCSNGSTTKGGQDRIRC